MSQDDRIHVLQLLQGLNIGGIERMAGSLVRGLDGDEFRSSFCTFDWRGKLAQELQDEGYAIHHRKRRGRFDLGLVLWLAKLLRRERIDVIQGHNATALAYGAAASMLVSEARFLYTEHDRAFPSTLRERGLHAVLARRTDAVATVSQTLRQNLVRYESFPSERVHVVRNGVTLPRPAHDRTTMRKELALGERPTVGIVARLAPVKNHALLLRAWKQVLRDLPDAVLLIVGNGSQEGNLQQLHTELALGDSVRFLGFRLDVSELLLAMDVFVLCSFSEGLSLTLLEAEACGLPVVATDVGGNPEVVRHEETGVLVPSNEDEPLARTLARLLQDPALCKRFGESGRAFYDRHYTLQAMVDGYARLYRVLCGRDTTGSVRPEKGAPELVAIGEGS